MQISTHVDKSIPEDSPLKKPDVMRMLMFIKLSLDQDKTIKKAGTNQKLSLESLRLVSDDDEDDDEDDDDEEVSALMTLICPPLGPIHIGHTI